MSKNQAAKQHEELPAVREAVPPPVAHQDLSQVMAESGVTASDIVIPKLLLMQNTSELVGDEKAKLGDIINSETNEVLGGLDKPVLFIPIKSFKTWQVMDMSGKQAEFLRSEPVTSKNEKLPWEDMENGKPIRRDMCMNFLGLLAADVEKDEAFPVVVRFKRTSTGAGKQLATTMYKMAVLGRTVYSQVVALSVRKDKFESNTYALFELTKGRVATGKEHDAAREWTLRLKSITPVIREDASEEAPQPGAAPAPTVVGASAGPDIF
jgi:hypothetical protein